MMKAFSFLTILESLSKKLSILRTKMHSDDLRVNHGTITRLLRVTPLFSHCASSGASFDLSRRVSHFAAILTILFTIGVGNVWGEITCKTITNPTGEVYSVTPATLHSYYNNGNGWVANGSGGEIGSNSYYSSKNGSSNKNYIDPETESTPSTNTAASGITLKTADNRSARFYFTGAVKVSAFIAVTGSGRYATLTIYKKSDDSQVTTINGKSYGSSGGYEKIEVAGLSSSESYYAKVTATNDLCLYAIKFFASSGGGDATTPVTGVSLNKTTTTLEIGEKETLTATIEPDNATNKDITWSSDATSVATVDENGVVTAVAAGTANIAVTTEDGNKTATCAVTVNAASGGGTGDDSYMYFVAEADATTNGVKNSQKFTDAPTGGSSAVGSFSFNGKECTVTKRTGNAKYTITFEMPDGWTKATLVLVHNQSSRNFTLKHPDKSTTTGETKANGNFYENTFTITQSGTYTISNSDNIGLIFIGLINNSSASTPEPETYSINYECDGATSGCPSNATEQTALPNPLPSAPTKTGYTFVGWYTDAEKTTQAVAGATLTSDITLYAKWNCTAPTSVTIDGAWDKFGGETISLTATATGGSGNYTYQWQKYYGSTWNNITDNATATTANLVYENCDGSHSGTYRCVVSTGTDCSTASNDLQVKVYTLECYTNGTNIYHFTRNGDTQSGTLTLNLNANTAYKFKVHVDNDYYGNGGTINKDETNWVLGAELGTPDLTVNSGLGGTFTFTVDYSASGNSNTLGVPEISVTYPRKTIYLKPGVWIADGAKYAIYYFIDGHDAWSDLLVGDACGTYTTIPQWNGVTMVAVRLNSDATGGTWDKKWNQTSNIAVTNNDYITITGWGENDYTYSTYTPATYSITFNGNGNTGGSMTNVTGITCGGSATLTQNTFTRTGYTFDGWATAADGDVAHADKATISNITSNITLYAKWNAITYNITFDKESGTGGTTQVTATYNSSTIASITNPTRECYTFEGWYSGDNGTGSLVINTTGVLQANVSGYTGTNGVWIATENKTLYAKWTKNATTLLLQRTGSEATPAGGVAVGGDAGTLNCIAEQGTIASYQWKQNTRGSKDGAVNAVGTGATTANFSPKPTAAGSYWYYCVATDECGNEVETTLSGCFLFKALYTVTFNPNNGSVDPTSATQSESGAAIILPTPTRSGYMFTGWYTAASGGTKIGDAGDSYIPTANITLYAQWEHVLVFNLPNDFNGTTQEWAVSSDNSANKLQNYAYILVEVPEATSEGSVSWKGTGADANRTLYMYTNGTLDNSKSFTYSTSYVSQTFGSTNIITIGGKYYLKFSTTADWKAANVRIDLTTPCTAPTNAVINGGGTYNSGSNITLTVTANNITNGTTTYTWYRSNSGQEAAITAGPIQAASTNNTYVINSCVQSDAQVYYCLISNGNGCNAVASTSIAINVVTTYTLTYDANAGTDEVANMPAPEQHTPGTYTLSDLVPTRTGYTFAGWNRNPEGTGDNFNAAAQFTTGALNETLYAKWTPETYYINYYEAVGEVNDINGLNQITINGAPTSYTILDEVTLPALPAKDGYTATGWYSQWCVFENQENTQYWAGCTPTTGHNAGYYGHANYIVKYTLNTPVTPDPGTETCITLGENEGVVKTDGTATVGNYTITASGINWQGTSAKIDNDNDYIIITNSTGITAANVTAKSNILYVTYSSSIDGTESKTTEEITATNDFTELTLDVPNGTKYIKLQRENGGSSIYVSEICLTEGSPLPSCTTPILSNLENQKVCPGSVVTWTASNTAELADGETIAYQWTKNSTVLSNNATLTLNDITEAAGGTYVVTATVSADGKASATATKEVTLTVTPATATPTITASANTIFAGNPVTLTATCASSGVTYQWYTCNDAEGNGESAIGNAKNAEYTPSTATVGTYYYKVIVTGDGTNSCGRAEAIFPLVVSTPSAGCYDMIIFDSSDNDYDDIPATGTSGVEENSDATWTSVGTSGSNSSCNYTYGSKTYKKGWKFVNGSTSSDNRYIQFVIPEGYTGSLFLAAYSTSTNRTVFIDTKPTNTVNNTYASIHISATGTLGTASAVLNPGTYYVCATDGLHLVELSIEICSDVNCTDPQVTATVDNATICAGTENVTFTATNYADGAEFQWQKKDGNTWTDISGAISATYTIPSVTTAHAGQYRVIAEEGCKRMSEEIKLTVLTAPTFNTFATTASVMKGNALAISDVQATGATGYAWYKSTDNSFDVAADTKVGTSKDLLLAAASIPEAADQIFYLFCVASNSCGSVTSNAITVTVTPFIAEECATAGNEGEREFGFKNTSCSSITYGSKSAWETNSSKEYLTYTAPAGRYFATAKVTIAHTNNSKAVYGYSKDGGATWTYEETSSAVPKAYTTITIELPADVNAFCIGRNMDGKGTGTGKFYLAEICFTYTTMCTETTLTVGSYYNEYNISTQMDFVEPTFTLKAGETTLEGQTLTYRSSTPAIATVDEDGNVTFEGMTGTVTITAAFAGGEINETEYCACQATYTITVGCKDQAPKIVAAAGTNLNGCNNSITLEAKMQDGTTAFVDGTFQWYRDGVAIDGATSASYIVVRAGTYTVSRTYTCTMMSSNSAVVTNENVEPEVERLTPFQYYHVDKTYSNQMKNRHLFAVTSYGTLNGKRYHLTATRNGETLDLSSSTAFFTIPSSDNAVDTVMIDLNELKGKYAENDEIVITCAPINSCNNASAITSSITIHVIDQTPTLALICSGADGEGTRATKELVVGGDFLTGYNKADLCQQTGNTTFDPNTEWGFYTELKEKYIVTPVNGYAEFNKLNYEPFDILLLTDYPKASKSEAAATILDDMAALCDYRPLLSLKAHMVAKSPSKWAAKGFTTSPVVPATTSQYANIVCYAHPMFDELDDAHVEGIYHDHDDFNQLVYQILTGPGHEGSKGLQGFELKDADNFVTIGLIHYNAAAAVVEHDNHTHLEWTPAADDRQLVAIAERQANIEARMILFAINCGAQSMQTPMGRQVLLTCLDYLLKTDLIEVADCRLTFDNGEGNTNWDASTYEGTGTIGDGKWSTAANWGPEYAVVPGRNNDVRIAAPCTVDANEVEVLSVHITENGRLTIPADKSFTARSTILRADENGNVYPTNVEDISLGSNAGGNASLILNNERGDTKAGVAMYSTAKADTKNYSAAESTWQYIGTPHSDVQNAANNYYDSWLYQYDTGTQGWAVIPNGGPLVPFRGYCVTHPESPHTYWMEGTLVSTTNQDISIPANTFVVVANSWTAPIQIGSLADDDMEGLTDKTIYFFNTGSDPNQAGELNQGRYAAGTYVSVPIHSAPYTGDSYIPSMQGFYVVGGGADGTLHLDYERHVRAPRTNTPSGPMHAPARRVAADNEPQVAKFLFRGTRYDDRLIILERPDFTRGYDSGWDGEQWGGNAAAPMSYVVTETRWDAVSAIPEYEGTVIAFRAGEDSEYTIHFDYDGMEDALYLLDTDTQIYTRVLKGNSYTFTCADKAEHNRFILTRKAPQIATGTEHINTGENAKAVKFIKDDKIFIFVNGMLYDATGKMVIR